MMPVNAGVLMNAPDPILVTLDGIGSLVKLVHAANDLAPILRSPGGRTMSVRELHELNA